MLDLSLFLSVTALVDSLSTTQQILFLILLFSTERPVRTSLGFLLGVSGAYLVCGLVGLAFVDKLNALVRLFLPSFGAVDNQGYYLTQMLLGLGLFVAGPVYWRFKVRSKRPSVDHRLFHLVKSMNFGVALGLGAFLSVTSFPVALPYVAAIEKIAAASLPPLSQGAFVLWYNVVYAVPLLVPFGLFIAVREAILPRLHRHVEGLNLAMTILLLSGVGVFFLADSAAFFIGGASFVPRVDTMFPR